MRLSSGDSSLRGLLGAFCAVGSLAIGGCTSDEVNQPQAPNSPKVPISATVAPTSGLVGEWKLDEMGGTIAEDTKNGYDATVQGGAAFIAGKLGRALNLNNGTAGTGGKYAEMPNNAALDNVQEGDYTISAWFFPYTLPSGTSGTANQRWAVVVKAGFHMGIAYEPNKFHLRHYLTGDTLKAVTSSPNYGLNSWHHVAGVVSKTDGTVTLYVDGVQEGRSTFTPNRAARDYGTIRFRIGKGSSNWAADGKVDQVRIYNRALSPAEISDLYNETTGGGTQVSNCIGAPSPGAEQTIYSERRVFLESQGWWGKRKSDGINVPRYGDAEHIHVGMCFPLLDTVSGTTTFRVRVMAHRLPVGSVVQSTSLHDPNDGPHHISLASIQWNHTITQADHDSPDGWVKWDSVTFNTNVMPNGLRELRNLTKVVRPADAGQSDGAEIHASSGWCWTIENGTGTPVASGTCTGTGANFTMARGWYDCFEYKIAEVRNWDPYASIPRGVAYNLTISGRDGAGDNTLMSGWEVRLDANFHHDTLGFKVDSGGGSATGRTVTIPAAQMTGPKVHKLVVIGSANGKCTATSPSGGIIPQDGEVSAAFAIPIKVQ
jgi:hypothetical protein